jgi:hypothetical protein
MQRDERREWYKELRGHRAKALNAPSWLWWSVVDLPLEHQRGYLEHCRAVSAIAWDVGPLPLLLPFVPHLLGRFILPQPHIDGLP